MIEPDVKVIEIGGQRVEVRELTVGEIRAWLRDPAPVPEAVDVLLFEGLPLYDLRRFTSLTPEQESALTPARLRELWEAVKAMNPDFFGLRARLEKLGAVQIPAAISTAPSRASSAPATPTRRAIPGLFSRLWSKA